VPAETIVGHGEPTQLRVHVRAACDVRDVFLPLLEDLLALRFTGEATHTEGCAEVIEDKQRVRHRSSERQIVAVLVMVVPRVVRQAELAEQLYAATEVFARVLAFESAPRNAERSRIGVARARVTDAAQ